MSIQGYGDAARWTAMALHGARLKAAMETLSHEMSSGQKSDLPQHLGLDASRVNEIDVGLGRMAAFDENGKLAATLLATQQAALGKFETARLAVAKISISGTTRMTATIESAIQAEAESNFGTMVASLRVKTAGRFVFSGDQPAQSPLPPAEDILHDLRGTINFSQPAAQISQDIEDYFLSSTGTFATTHYQGGTDSVTIPVSEQRNAQVGTTADHIGLRQILAETAKLALIGSYGTDQAKIELANDAGTSLQGMAQAIHLKGTLGAVENLVDSARGENSATRTAVIIERNARVSADPLETATQLKQAEVQLEVHYNLLNRMSKLSLVNYS